MFSDEHASIISELRRSVSDVIHLSPYTEDEELLNWLIAREFNVGAASKMFRKSMEWRKKYCVNEILQWKPPSLLLEYFPYGSCGRDRLDHKVYIYNMGLLDMRGLMRCVKRTDMLNFGIWQMEKFKAENGLAGSKLPPTGCCRGAEGAAVTGGRRPRQTGIVVDLKSLQLSQLTNRPGLDVLLEWIQIFEANYPNTLSWCLGINVPTIFSLAWTLISPLLNEVTRSKIQLLASDSWQEQLLQLVDPQQLPVYWGGTKRGLNNSSHCAPQISLGGVVPEKHLTCSDEIISKEKTMPHSLDVRAGATSSLNISVARKSTHIKFEFVTRGGDICYRLLFSPGEGMQHQEEILPKRLVFSHLLPEDGVVTALRPGVYTIEFDNQSSYFKRKLVFARFEALVD